jgi:hypothetical protein
VANWRGKCTDEISRRDHEVLVMPYRIQVPLNSPALDSYLNDGWRQARTEGQWAVLQMDELEVSDYPDVVERDREDPGRE